MADVTATALNERTNTDTDAWVTRVAELTGRMDQAGLALSVLRGAHEGCGASIARVSPQIPGQLTKDEYQTHLRPQMFVLLHFMDAPTREALAGQLVAEYARRHPNDTPAMMATE